MIIHSRKNSIYVPEGTHSKYMNEHGNYVPSVTTIIKMIPKDALIYWANNLGWKRKSVYKELEYSAYVGTYVHNYIEKIISTDSEKNFNQKQLSKVRQKIIDNHTDIDIKNSLLSFLDWYVVNRDSIELIELEKSMSSTYYGGTCDMICRYNGKLMIFDFKTSGDFYFSMFIQLAAYVKLYEKCSNEKIDDVAVLRVDKKNGKIAKLKKLTDIENGDIDYYYHVFDQCLNLFLSVYLLEKDWKIK